MSCASFWFFQICMCDRVHDAVGVCDGELKSSEPGRKLESVSKLWNTVTGFKPAYVPQKNKITHINGHHLIL